MVDPWAGYNAGMNNLNDTFVNIRNQDRQALDDEMKRRALRQQLALGDLQVDEATRKAGDAATLRTQLAGLQPTTTTTITPPTVNAGTPSKMLGVGVSPGAQYLNNLPQKPLSGSLDSEMQANGLAEPPTDASGFSVPQPQASPTVQAYNEGRIKSTTTTPDPFVTAAKFWADKGDFEKAQAVMAAAKQHAEEQGNMAAVGSGNLTDYYTKIAKASLSSTQSKQIESGLKTIADLAKEGPQYLKMAEPSIQQIPGFEKFTADAVSVDPSKRFSTIDMGNGQTVIIDSLNPKDWKLEKKDPVTDLQIAVKGFDAANPNATPQERAAFVKQHEIDMAKAKRQVIVNNPTGGGGDENDVAAWAKAVKEGRANLQDVPNRGTVRSRVVKLLESGGGVDYAANNAENKANAGSIAQQQKQIGAMGSFVKNIDKQVTRFEQISKEISSFDTRLLNVPLRAIRGRVAGSPNQAKIDMYLAEISSETGKLASGATGSVAELSQGAREKWEKIHDPNLSMKDLLDLLKETRHAGQMRMDSVREQLDETKAGMRNRGGGKGGKSLSSFWK